MTTDFAEQRKQKFLEILRSGDSAKGASRLLAVPMNYFYRLRKDDPEFGRLWAEAYMTNAEKREALIRERNFGDKRAPTKFGPPPPVGGKKGDPSYRIKFLAELAKGASVTRAAEAADVAYITVFKWKQHDPDFADEWETAVQQGIDRLEDEAFRRGVEGYRDTVYDDAGQVIQSTHRYSDQLLTLMLRAKSAYYRRDAEAPGGQAVIGTVNIVSVPSGKFLSADEVQRSLNTLPQALSPHVIDHVATEGRPDDDDDVGVKGRTNR